MPRRGHSSDSNGKVRDRWPNCPPSHGRRLVESRRPRRTQNRHLRDKMSYVTVMETLRKTRHQEEVLRLRRYMAMRLLVDEGCVQREIAEALGSSQPAVSQQLVTARTRVGDVPVATALEAAAPLLVDRAASMGFSDLAVFGSVARGSARPDSDVDLIAKEPPGATFTTIREFRDFAAGVLGVPVDFITYGGLRPGVDDDVLADAVPLS